MESIKYNKLDPPDDESNTNCFLISLMSLRKIINVELIELNNAKSKAVIIKKKTKETVDSHSLTSEFNRLHRLVSSSVYKIPLATNALLRRRFLGLPWGK